MRLALTAVFMAAFAAPLAAAALDYPESPRGKVVDTYHGDRLADPYRWLEDLDAPATSDWVARQNALSLPFLAALPEHDGFQKRLTSLWNYERFDPPVKAAGQYFYTSNDGLQNQSVLYVQKGDALPRPLLDPNRLSTDGTIALAGFFPSPDGRQLAYATAAAGSDWHQVRIRDVDTSADAAETLTRIKFSDPSWTRDSAGFFYSRYPDAPAAVADPESKRAVFDGLADQKIYYHRLGTPQSQDRLVFELPSQPKWFVSGDVTPDGRYLVITLRQGSAEKCRLYLLDLVNPLAPQLDGKLIKLVDHFDDSYQLVGSHQGELYLKTDRQAPRGQVVRVDPQHPDPKDWKTVVAQSPDTLIAATVAGGRIAVLRLHDASSQVELFTPEGKPSGHLKLPGAGSISDTLKGDPADPELLLGYTAFNQPLAPYRADVRTRQVTPLRRLKLAFDPAQYVTEQVFYPSRDGTRVPLFISYRKGLKRDSRARVFLHGYGGFNVPKTPAFDVSALAWMEKGGVYAVASLRGGGEYGEDWHAAGTRERKQNVFDDFVAAARYLVNHGYTAYPRIAIWGRSNGGLLVGASVNQHPELWGAAVATVGVMDMLRFHKFTVGYAWTSDYGSSDDAAGYEVLRRYSPLHTVQAGTHYPPTLITTGDHDDRVHPSHSFKYAATLQAAQGGDAPILLRVDTRAGHGSGKPVSKVIEEEADKLAFMWHYTQGPAASGPQRKP